MNFQRFFVVALATALISACASAPPAGTSAAASPGLNAPAGWSPSGGTSRISGTGSISYQADGPYPVDLRTVPVGEYDPNNQLASGRQRGRIESQVSDDAAERLREEALLLPPQFGIDQAFQKEVSQRNLTEGASFDSLDYTDCCGGGGNVPPDPELAVGPNHIIAVVNVAFAIYDKSGALLSGPTTFSSFFAGTPGCSNTSVFDPNAIYDESADRFIIGIDGNGTDNCVAATSGADPLGTWNRYGFATDINGNFFDFPHVGVGLDAIYMGANMFGGSFAEGRLWAMDKFDLYSGASLTVVTQSTGNDGTPQPMHLHGWNQGTWPLAGPHYIITDDQFNGATYAVWSWEDPFGLDDLNKDGTVNLSAATGVSAGFPVDWPQAGSSANLQGNDWRVQDADYRNGDIWMSTTIACNPGGGTVNCARWARIDPTGPSVIDAGVLASNGEYRTFPNVAANHCDDMALGYTKGSATTFASIYVAGRESGDAPGTLQTEMLLKAGEVAYSSFGNDPPPHRWGDYTEMAADPDGQTFWYLGEYSKETGAISKWGTYIGSFSFGDCGVGPGAASNPSPANGASGVDTEANLSWTAGANADSHDVYFGTDSTPDAGEFQGNQAGTTFDPGTLANSSTFYWRIDEVNVDGTTTGTVWSFTTEAAPIPPGPASNPSPADGASGVGVNADLSWDPGANADSYDVYLDGVFQGNTTGTSYDPGTLTAGTLYNWYVVSKNAFGTADSATWSFTTAAQPKFKIADVSVTDIPANGPRTRGQATVTVRNVATNALVDGVEVSGTFSGDWSGVRSGTTGANGQVVLQTPPVKNGSSYDFCVDTASKAGWAFDQVNSVGLCNGPPPATGSVQGTVTDNDTGLPIAGADVSASSGQNDTTNASGDYLLTDVPVGSPTVSASASGYQSENQVVPVTDGGTSTANFALDPNPVGGSVRVRSVTVTTVNQGRGVKNGRATVVVEDDVGNLVSGAIVTGDFTGSFNEPGRTSGPTNASGSTAIDTNGSKKGGISLTFCVTDIAHPGLADFSGLECDSL